MPVILRLQIAENKHMTLGGLRRLLELLAQVYSVKAKGDIKAGEYVIELEG